MLLYALSAEFGSQLTFHPHIHVIVTGGGLSLDKQRGITTDPKFLIMIRHCGIFANKYKLVAMKVSNKLK